MTFALPPYAALLGALPERDADGAPILLLPFADRVLGRPGFLHGGAIAGLLEQAALAALRHALGAGDTAVRIEQTTLTVDFQRGGRERDTRAAGTVTRLGTRIANVVAIAWQDDRARPIASARMNCLLEPHGIG